jgi:uncharacterized protein
MEAHKARNSLPGQIEEKRRMATHEELTKHMQELRQAIPELIGLLLASSEGSPITHSLSNGTDPDCVAAMAAAASSLGRRISHSMNAGTACDISIQGAKGAIFFYSAGSKAVLAVICQKGSNAGLVRLEARATAKKISDLFQRNKNPG